MICNLGTSCTDKATQTLNVNDWRSGFVEKTYHACEKCLADQPALLKEHEEWLARNPKARPKKF